MIQALPTKVMQATSTVEKARSVSRERVGSARASVESRFVAHLHLMTEAMSKLTVQLGVIETRMIAHEVSITRDIQALKEEHRLEIFGLKESIAIRERQTTERIAQLEKQINLEVLNIHKIIAQLQAIFNQHYHIPAAPGYHESGGRTLPQSNLPLKD